MKKFSFKLFCLFLMYVLMLPCTGLTASATEADAEGILSSIITFNKESEFIDFIPASLTHRVASVTDITINFVGMSSFIDFSKAGFDVDETLVKYESSNVDVAVGYEGRILATGVGTATITISYEDKVQIINVTVLDEIPESLIRSLETSTLDSLKSTSSESSQRLAIAQKAMDMVYLRWKPTKNVRGWKNDKTFYAGTTYTGIPYSQTWYQVDDNEFMSAMDKDDFYSNYTSGGKIMPKYGNDCSAFVAITWGSPYQGDNRYNTWKFEEDFEPLDSYADLQKGDAVVTNTSGNHMFLITINFETPPSGSDYNTSYVVCYEQTPYQAQLTFWTYDQLSKNNYIPISKF